RHDSQAALLKTRVDLAREIAARRIRLDDRQGALDGHGRRYSQTGDTKLRGVIATTARAGNLGRCGASAQRRRGSAPCGERRSNLLRRLEVEARVAKRHPLKALAEQAPRMGRGSIVVARERPQALLLEADVAQVHALRAVDREQLRFEARFLGRESEDLLATIERRKGLGTHPTTGQVVLGELTHRHFGGEKGGQKIRDVVILVAALPGGGPDLVDPAL